MMDLREYWTLQSSSGAAVIEQTPVISNFTEPLLADNSGPELNEKQNIHQKTLLHFHRYLLQLI
jgi:hypothetical protein